MRRFAFRLLIVILLCACGISVGAESVKHGFPSMFSAGEIDVSNSAVGVTDFVTYTCTGCYFGLNGASEVSICMGKNNYVVISPALNKVKSLTITYTYAGKDSDYYKNFNVYVSEDGSTWGDALTGSTRVTSTSFRIAVPEGYYFIKIANTKSTTLYIVSIEYEFDSCPSCNSYVY